MKYWGTPRTRNSQTSTSGRNQNAEEGNMGDNRFQDDETSNKAWEKKTGKQEVVGCRKQSYTAYSK